LIPRLNALFSEFYVSVGLPPKSSFLISTSKEFVERIKKLNSPSLLLPFVPKTGIKLDMSTMYTKAELTEVISLLTSFIHETFNEQPIHTFIKCEKIRYSKSAWNTSWTTSNSSTPSTSHSLCLLDALTIINLLTDLLNNTYISYGDFILVKQILGFPMGTSSAGPILDVYFCLRELRHLKYTSAYGTIDDLIVLYHTTRDDVHHPFLEFQKHVHPHPSTPNGSSLLPSSMPFTLEEYDGNFNFLGRRSVS
jgi:hypothetical protein